MTQVASSPFPLRVDAEADASRRNRAYALLCKLFPEKVIDLLKGEIEAAYYGGVTIADDKERSKLETKLGELERQEERTIREAAAAGVRIAWRADVRPEVLLAG